MFELRNASNVLVGIVEIRITGMSKALMPEEAFSLSTELEDGRVHNMGVHDVSKGNRMKLLRNGRELILKKTVIGICEVLNGKICGLIT